MCGIVGYVGPHPCVPILVDGLRLLEYRGYDSAGLVVLDPDKGLDVVRVVGRLSELDKALRERPRSGTTGIGHTRWATHGRAAIQNAHPHVAGRVAVVHNGILENHAELRSELTAAGRIFLSETDSEIAAHLIDIELDRFDKDDRSLLAAVRRAVARFRGAFALAVVSSSEPGVIALAKRDSPLVIGVGEGEMFVASDVPALLPNTRDVIFLEDGEIAEVRASSLKIERLSGDPGQAVTRASKHIDWSIAQAEKQGFKHFMLKEIFEQPAAVENTIRGHLSLDHLELDTPEVGLSDEDIKATRRILLVACGTSYHASMVGRIWIEAIARIPTEVDLASELRYRDAPLGPGDLVIAVSQSGETADTLAAVMAAAEKGANTLAVVNVVGSAISRAASGSLYTYAGPEISVPSTKCYTAGLAALFMLAVFLGRSTGALSPERARELLQGLVEVPRLMREVLGSAEAVRAIARRRLVTPGVTDCLFLGRGLSFPAALEGALKLKEASYVHAEGYAAGEIKHGPIALVDAQMPVIVVAPKDRHYDKISSNVQEIRAREAIVIAVVTRGDTDVAAAADEVLEIPAIDPYLSPFLTALPLQLLAYYTADCKGTDIDQPRNLDKIVTVE
jgi:glucosamine--fructose-6-phosphate aminotransferase (isomerizing)